MPSGEYSSVSRGALKIKGVQGSKVDKHKKKKKKAKDGSEEVTGPSASKEQEKTGSGDDGNTRQEQALDDTLREEDGNVEEPIPERGTGKTEVEKNFDERRRKMVCCCDRSFHSVEIMLQ